MAEGYILDNARNAQQQARWVDGPPTFSWWGRVTPSDTPQFNVIALRCEKCGWLDLFARERHY